MSKGTVNKVIILGRLGQEPEIRYTGSGAAIANLSVATTDSYKDKQTGQTTDNTEWHRVVFFGKQAEVIGEHCQKGSQLYIEGRLRTNKWQDQQGQDKYTTEIIGREFQFIGSKQDSQQAQQAQQQQSKSSSNAYAQAKGRPVQQQPNVSQFDNNFDDKLPF